MGGTLIFSYTRRLGYFLGVQNFEFQDFLGFQKNNYFGGYEVFVDILGFVSKLDYIKGSFLCIIGSFRKVKVHNGDIFGVTLLCIGTFYSCNGMYVPNFSSYEILKWTAH